MLPEPIPPPLFSLRVHDLATAPGRTGACIGYELGEWRYEALANHLMEWLPEFALTYTERSSLRAHNSVASLRKAAKAVYTSSKFKSRGEFGELLLHILIRQAFGTFPAISKLYYKTAPNDTVKGFDAVHVVEANNELELWLGEAKFYTDFASASREAIASLKDHCARDYLRTEFAVIGNHIDPHWPKADALKALLDHKVSLDQVFARVCLPVLITYESAAVNAHTSATAQYVSDFSAEVITHAHAFEQASKGAKLPPVKIHLFLLPLHTKIRLLALLDKKLKGLQSL